MRSIACVIFLAPLAGCRRSSPDGSDAAIVADSVADAIASTTIRPPEPADAGVAASPTPKPRPVPPAFSGTFHLLAGQPAVNLVVVADGTFVWRYDDCVCAGGGWGTWEPDGASLVLTPPAEGLQWATIGQLDGGARTVDRKPAPANVTRVALTPSASGFVAVASWSIGGTQSQPWSRGRVCPVCRPMVPGPLPTGADAVACNEPMPMHHHGPGLACH